MKKKLRKFRKNFDIEKWLWKSEIGNFWSLDLELVLIYQNFFMKKVLFFTQLRNYWMRKMIVCTYLSHQKLYAQFFAMPVPIKTKRTCMKPIQKWTSKMVSCTVDPFCSLEPPCKPLKILETCKHALKPPKVVEKRANVENQANLKKFMNRRFSAIVLYPSI